MLELWSMLRGGIDWFVNLLFHISFIPVLLKLPHGHFTRFGEMLTGLSLLSWEIYRSIVGFPFCHIVTRKLVKTTVELTNFLCKCKNLLKVIMIFYWYRLQKRLKKKILLCFFFLLHFIYAPQVPILHILDKVLLNFVKNSKPRKYRHFCFNHSP